jgi:hypothetical protein
MTKIEGETAYESYRRAYFAKWMGVKWLPDFIELDADVRGYWAQVEKDIQAPLLERLRCMDIAAAEMLKGYKKFCDIMEPFAIGERIAAVEDVERISQKAIKARGLDTK